MPSKRSGYASFNKLLYALKDFERNHHDRLINETPGWGLLQTTALDALVLALAAASVVFPRRDETP